MNVPYTIFLTAAILEMIWEVRISQKNSAELLKSGAVEVSKKTLPVMTVIYLLTFAGAYFENMRQRPVIGVSWALTFSLMFLGAKLLKLWAVRTLGRFWTMRVLIVPGSKAVATGPYRWIRHPNYVAVLLELAAIPLLGKAFLVFLFAFLSFSGVLYFRIRSEETGLLQHTDYRNSMHDKRRFI